MVWRWWVKVFTSEQSATQALSESISECRVPVPGCVSVTLDVSADPSTVKCINAIKADFTEEGLIPFMTTADYLSWLKVQCALLDPQLGAQDWSQVKVWRSVQRPEVGQGSQSIDQNWLREALSKRIENYLSGRAALALAPEQYRLLVQLQRGLRQIVPDGLKESQKFELQRLLVRLESEQVPEVSLLKPWVAKVKQFAPVCEMRGGD